jgi:purine-cytosine permease-like protein
VGVCSINSQFKLTGISWKIFLYTYLGLFLPVVGNVIFQCDFTNRLLQTLLQCTGAAVVASAPAVPLWEQAYANGNVGGLLEAMLRPLHGFGKFLAVLLSLSVVANLAVSLYSVSLNLQLFSKVFLKVPRYIFSTIGTAMRVVY